MDKHICGPCGSQYSTIEDFIHHKRNGCNAVPTTSHQVTFGLRLSSPIQSKGDSSEGQNGQHQLGNQRVASSTPVNLDTISETPEGSSGSSKKPEVVRKKKKGNKKSAEKVPRETPRKNPGEKRKPKQYIKQYKCEFEQCKFVTAHQKDLLRHRRIHTGEKPYSCNFCEKRFSRDDKRKLHERAHTKEKPFACEACTYRCADGGSLKKHMRIHSGDRPYQCQLCSYASRNASQLVVHLRRHTGDAPFHCQQCDAKFKTNTDLKRHILIHTGSKPFACDQCNYRSHLKCNLKSHIQTNHKGKIKYKCDTCSFQCRTQKQMDNHSRTEHAETRGVCSTVATDITAASQEASKKNKSKSSRNVFSCDCCSYSAKNNNSLSIHMKKKHPDKEKATPRVKTSTKLRTSKTRPKSKEGAKFIKTRTSKLSVPIFDGKRPWTCKHCEASFVREDSYRSHRRQHEKLQKGNAERCSNVSNSSETIVITVNANREPVSGCENLEHYHSGKSDAASSSNDTTQLGDLSNQITDEIAGISTLHAFSVSEIPATGAEVCIPEDTSLVNSAIGKDIDTDATRNILPETNEPQVTVCPGELITMMPVDSNGRPDELSNHVLPSGIIVAQDSDTYVQEVVQGEQLLQEEAIQTQTLGYGTSNIPVLLSSCQTVVIDASKTCQNQVNMVESVGASIAQPSEVTYVSLSNVGIGGAKSIPVTYANLSQAVQPALALGVDQQVASKQPQEIHGGDQSCFGSVNIATNNNAMSVNPASFTVSNLGVSISNAVTGPPTHGQISMQATSLPTRTFILNGRELSQARPVTEINSDTILLPKVPQ